MESTTIAAIATPTGRGGIGIIRISGDHAIDIARRVFIFSDQSKIRDDFQSHRVYYGYIQDRDGQYIDEVLLIYMKAPKSYTAEDVVEIQSHASPIVLRKILDVVLASGAKPAESGEFTKRAFINGRIDLTQAEAVIDIINARTGTSLDMAVSQIRGQLRQTVETLIDILGDTRARLEAAIDFPDDVGDVIDQQGMQSLLKHYVLEPLAVLKQNFEDCNIFRDGIKLVIAGPPNSGKSSLLNALLEKEKSIVTPIPGTTRDLIDDLINIQGIPFEITDTAGIQESRDQVEQIGISRTLEKISTSDVLVIMYDGSKPVSAFDQHALNDLIHQNKQSKKIVLVENKIDLYNDSPLSGLDMKPDIHMSVIQKKGLEELKKMIADKVIEDMPENRNSVVPNVRHAHLIEQAIEACNNTLVGLGEDREVELIALDLDECLSCLEDIVGRVVHDDVLDRIFNNFCIGK